MASRKRILGAGLVFAAAVVGVWVSVTPNPASSTLLPGRPTLSNAPTHPGGAPLGVSHDSGRGSGSASFITTAEQAIAAAAPSIEISSRNGGFLERDGALTYKGRGYLVTADGSGLTAGFLAKSPREESPTFSLSLDEVRVGETRLALDASAMPGRESAPSSLAFNRGALLERVRCEKDAFEQDFIISELPEGRGAITVVERIGTTLAPPVDGSRGSSLLFGTKESGAFEVSKAVAIDAQGRRFPLDLGYSRGQMVITVPASWVESATLPIVIDPVVGSPFPISGPLTGQPERSAVAYGSGPNEWLVVWYDQANPQNTSYQVYAQRVSATGTLSGSQIPISTVSAINYNSSVTYCAGLNQYLVLWAVSDSNSNDHMTGRFVTATGTTPNPQFDLGTYPQFLPNMNVATDGVSTFYAVAENQVSGGTLGPLVGVLISTSGSIIAQPSPQPNGAGAPTRPRVTYSNGEYLVSWREGTTCNAVGMNTSGTFLTPITTVSTNVSQFATVAVSAGNNQFLIAWNDSAETTLLGQVAAAGTGSTINFTTSAFPISTSSTAFGFQSSSYSSTTSQWFVAHGGSGAIAANLVTASGSTTSDQSIVAASGYYPKTAWNSATGDTLVIYENMSNPNADILTGVRFNSGSTAPPPAPANLTATGGNQSVSLTWSASPGAATYQIFRATTSGGFGTTPLQTVTTTTFTDTNGLTNGTFYFYIVEAANAGGVSGPSNQAVAEPVPLPPGVPTGLVATGLNDEISLSWTAVSGATEYHVQRGIASGGPYQDFVDALTVNTNSFVDTTAENGTRYYYIVSSGNGITSSAFSAEVSAIPNPPSTFATVLFVVGKTTLSASDAAIKTRLINLGYAVVVKPSSSVASTDATGRALVVISSSASASAVGTKFRTVTVPVLNNLAGAMGNLGMTGTTSGTNFGTTASQTQLSMVAANASNPLSAGLTGKVTVETAAETFTWGKPNANAAAIATLTGDATKIAIFGYPAGAAMPGLAAPASRVGFFLSGASASKLNASGVLLFNAAVHWATAAPSSPLLVSVNYSSGAAHIYWTPVQGAQTYSVLRSTSATGPFTLIASGLTVATYTDTIGAGTYTYEVVASDPSGNLSAPVAAQAVTGSTTSNLVVGLTGPRYIHAYRAVGGNPPDSSNQGSYTAVVFLENAGTYTPADPATIVGAWTVVPLGGNNAPVTVTQTNTTCLIQANSVEPNVNDLSFWGLFYKVTVGTQSKSVSALVAVTYREYLHVHFRFPQNAMDGAPGQTERQWADGTPNHFFDPDDTTRASARNDFASNFTDQVIPILQQAGIQLYVTIDPLLLTISGFDSSGQFMATDDVDQATPATMNLVTGVNQGGAINVYLMKTVTQGSNNTVIGGYTHRNVDALHGAWFGDLITLPDDATPQTFAHEIGHSVGLSDVVRVDQISGDLGNLNGVIGLSTATIPAQNPLNWNLMRQLGLGRLEDSRGSNLSSDQARDIWFNTINSPAAGGSGGLKD